MTVSTAAASAARRWPRARARGLWRRDDRRGRRLARSALQRLQPPLELGAAQLQHLEGRDRLGRALGLSALGGLGPAGAPLGEHRAVDHLAAGPSAAAAGAAGRGGGSKPRAGACSAARAPLSHATHRASGGGSISAAPTT